MTEATIMNVLLKCLPHSDQISGLEFNSGHVYFKWRGEQFRVDDNLEVASVDGQLLSTDNISIILSSLLKRTWVQLSEAK